jgi:glutathione S-transferase
VISSDLLEACQVDLTEGWGRDTLPAMTSAAQLFFLPGAGSFAPHVMLEEAGIAHELLRVFRDEQSVPVEPAGYLALNPSGRIPTIIWADGTVQTESAAICLTAAEAANRESLIPAIGHAERAEVLARLLFLTNTVQIAILRARYPDRFADDDAGRASVAARGNRDLVELRDRCAGWYAHGKPFLRGDEPGVDDVFLGMLIRWTRLSLVPWWDNATLSDLYDRFHAWPSVARAREQEQFEARPPAGT